MANLNVKTSVVDYLKSKGEDSSFSSRAKLATQYGIKDYTGSSAQNSLLLSKLSTSAPASSSASEIKSSTKTKTASQTSVSSTNVYDKNTTTAEYGNSNAAVLALQKSLNAKGANLVLDSKYGDLTKAAVEQYGGGGTDFSNVNTIADANKAINSGQSSDISKTTTTDEPPVKKSYSDIEKIMSDLKTTIAPETEKPEAPDYSGALTDFRAEYGVDALENQLTDLQAQAREIEAAFNVQKNAETGKPVAMNVIEGRVSEEQKAALEKLDAINNSISTVNDQLKMKYGVIEDLMGAKEMDYNASVALYDKEMSTNMSIFSAAKGIAEEEESDIEHTQDVAKSNAQIMLNALNATGQTWDKLSSTQQNNLTKLGVQSGLGGDFFSTVLAVSAGKDILTTLTSSDKTEATIVYKDGTTKNISTGLTPKAKDTNADGSPKTPTVAEQKNLLQEFLTTGIAPNGDKLGNPRGADGFVDPGVYIKAFEEWTGTAKDFLTYFPVEKNVNPASYKLLPEAIRPKTTSKRTI
jgi:hypothetical protein